MVNKDEVFRVTTENPIIVGDEMWFSHFKYPTLYRVKKNEKFVDVAFEFDDEKTDEIRLFGQLIYHNGNLYLPPFSASKMYCISLNDHKVKTYDFEQRYYEQRGGFEKFNLLSSHLFGSKIFMISGIYPAIIEFDCDTEKVRYIDNWIDEIYDYVNIDDGAMFRKTFMHDGKLFLPLCSGNAVLIYDINEDNYSYKVCGENGNSYSSLSFDGKSYWLAPRNSGPVIKCSEGLDKWEKIEDESLYDENACYADIVYHDGYVYLLPRVYNYVLRINVSDDTVEKTVDKYQDVSYFIYLNHIYFYDNYKGGYFSFDEEKVRILSFSPQKREALYEKYNLFNDLDIDEKIDIMHEEELARLDSFIRFVSK